MIQQCLHEPTRASDYAALLAALPDALIGTRDLQGGWHIIVEIEGASTEDIDAIFVPGGQYCETGLLGSLEGLGFGSWHVTDPDTGAFEVISQKLLSEEAECIGWVQTTYSGLHGEPERFEGIGTRTTFNLQGDTLGTLSVILKASRPNMFPVAARCSTSA